MIPRVDSFYLRRLLEKQAFRTWGSLQHTASLLCLSLLGRCSPRSTPTPKSNKVPAEVSRRTTSVAHWGSSVQTGFPYPGPLRGGWVCAAFGALLQPALIAPHRTVRRKSSGGVSHKKLHFVHGKRRELLKLLKAKQSYLSVYPVMGFHL